MAADVFLFLYKEKSVIKGSSTDAVFPKAIQLKTFSMDAEGTVATNEEEQEELESRADQMSMAVGGEVSSAESPLDSFSIEFTKEYDLSSTALFKNYAATASNAKVFFTKAEVFCRIGGPKLQPGMKPEQLCLLVYEFRNLYIYDYSLSASGEISIPVETCKMYFDAYRITYRPQLKSGRLGTALPLGWDFENEAAY